MVGPPADRRNQDFDSYATTSPRCRRVPAILWPARAPQQAHPVECRGAGDQVKLSSYHYVGKGAGHHREPRIVQTFVSEANKGRIRLDGGDALRSSV